MIHICISPEALADLMTQVYRNGFDDGRDGEPEPDWDETFTEYHAAAESMAAEDQTKH
jgi:hypothetical protein